MYIYRFPYSRGKKYRKYLMKPAQEREVHKDRCRKSMERRMDRKKQGTSLDTSLDAGNSGEGEGEGKGIGKGKRAEGKETTLN